jgi:hypothetical protein
MIRAGIRIFASFFAVMWISTAFGIATAQSGQALYEKKCGRCHAVYDPSDYAAEEWSGVVRSMKAQAALTAAEMAEITDYLTGASRGATSAARGPIVGGYLYSEYFHTQETTKNFDIHYLAFTVTGWANENIQYFGEFELEHGGKGENVFVEQAFIDYWLLPTLAVKAGAILTPFNRFDDFHDPIGNYLVTRPQVAREIGGSAWKEVGVDIHGYFNVSEGHAVTFDLYTINGLGSGSNIRDSRQYRDNNEKPAFGTRVGVLIGDMLEVGGSAYHGAWDDAGELSLEIYGAHALLNTPFAELYGEFTQAKSENDGDVAEGDMWGYFVQASRLFYHKYRSTIRAGELDYEDEGELLGRDPAKGNKQWKELALGFAYYPVPRVAFKIEYSFFDEGDRVVSQDNDQLALQAAVRF